MEPHTLHDTLGTMGCSRLRFDASFYLYTRGGVRIEIPVYVDDITISAPTDAEADKVVAELAEHFELRDLGDTSVETGRYTRPVAQRYRQTAV